MNVWYERPGIFTDGVVAYDADLIKGVIAVLEAYPASEGEIYAVANFEDGTITFARSQDAHESRPHTSMRFGTAVTRFLANRQRFSEFLEQNVLA